MRLVRGMASAIIGIVLGAWVGLGQGALGQDSVPMTSDQGAPEFSVEQLDQMLAPIALYPDPLLAQILMAATYPLEVIQAEQKRGRFRDCRRIPRGRDRQGR